MLVGGGGGFAGISEAVSGIVAASAAGFTISENGGQPLLNAIQDLQEEIRSALGKSSALEQEMALGTTPNANIYKPFLATVASDPSQGAIPVLKKLQNDLNDAHAAIQKSMANYHGTDQESAAGVNGTWV
jgi:hypothetical protein